LLITSIAYKLSDEQYSFAQRTAWAAAKNVTDIMEWIDKKVDEAVYLTEKEQGKHIDMLRETLS
jgi:hypothetical protein